MTLEAVSKRTRRTATSAARRRRQRQLARAGVSQEAGSWLRRTGRGARTGAGEETSRARRAWGARTGAGDDVGCRGRSEHKAEKRARQGDKRRLGSTTGEIRTSRRKRPAGRVRRRW